MGTLANLSTINSPSGRGRDALGVLLQESPFLAFLEQNGGWELDATNFEFSPISSAFSSIEARAEGGAYTGVDVAPGTKQTGKLAFHGAAVDVDISHKSDAAKGLRDIDVWFAKELKLRIKKFAVAYESMLFNGSGNSNNIKGLKTILSGSDLPGYTGVTRLVDAQAVTGGSTKSCDLTSSNNYSKFIEWLFVKMKDVKNATGLIMNTSLYARMWTIARKEQMLGENRDLFGVPVATFNNIPMIQVLDDTIVNTEPDNTATTALTETTSLYVMAPGEQNLSLVTNSGLYWMDYDHVENKESGREKFEIRASWKIEEPKSILRIRNIKV